MVVLKLTDKTNDVKKKSWGQYGIVKSTFVIDFKFKMCSRPCFFKRSTFVGSAWSFVFFIHTTTANDLRLWRIFYPRLYPLHLFSYLNYGETACGVFMVSILRKCFLSILVYNLYYRQTSRYFHTPQYLHTWYIGCLHEIEIQMFKKYGFLIGRKNRQ